MGYFFMKDFDNKDENIVLWECLVFVFIVLLYVWFLIFGEFFVNIYFFMNWEIGV